jgi:hypothetical protein
VSYKLHEPQASAAFSLTGSGLPHNPLVPRDAADDTEVLARDVCRSARCSVTSTASASGPGDRPRSQPIPGPPSRSPRPGRVLAATSRGVLRDHSRQGRNAPRCQGTEVGPPAQHGEGC